MPIQLSICESDLHFKNLLIEHINQSLLLDLIQEYSNGFELINRLKYQKNNFLLIDAFTPFMTGIEALKILRKKQNKTPIIIYTQMYQEDLYALFNAYQHVYYCQKNSAIIFKLLLALFQEESQAYERYLHEWQVQSNAGTIIPTTIDQTATGYIPSSVELKIINYACRGLTNNEIGREVHLSGRTVETYIKKLTEKFKLKNKVQLITYCVEQHLHLYK
ncbi:DNA-binding response regulator [Myroides sp. DW712]|uniref:response regulator transcription factor n=1 Tax=Myroides sp. DW712 TaxID=3389800 RepID=UPI00397A736A